MNKHAINTGLMLTNGAQITFDVSSKLMKTIIECRDGYLGLPDYKSNVDYRANMIKTSVSEIELESTIETSIVESLAAIMCGKVKNKNQQSALNMLDMLDKGILEEQNTLSHEYVIKIWSNLTAKNKEAAAVILQGNGYRKTGVKLGRHGALSTGKDIIYIAPQAKYVHNMMESLIGFYNGVTLHQDQFTNALLKAIIFSAYFVYIHPFLDGNGRTSRLLTNKLFVDHGLAKFRYVSYTSEIIKSKSAYSKALEEIERAESGDFTKYVELMVTIMASLLTRISDIEKGTYNLKLLSDRQRIMLNVIRGSAMGTHRKHYKNIWNNIAKEKGYKQINLDEADFDIVKLLLEGLIKVDSRYTVHLGYKYFRS